MNHETILDSIGRLPEDVIETVDAARNRKKSNPAWLKWGALAACLCVVLLTLPLLRQTAQSPSPNDPSAGMDGGAGPDDGASKPATDTAEPFRLTVNDRVYDIAYSDRRSETLPEGFAFAGNLEDGRAYYTNPDIPEWVYVYQQYNFGKKRDPETGKLVSDIRYVYFRWVDVRLCSRELLCYEGEYYISLNSASYGLYAEYPDMTEEYYNAMVSVFGGTRVEDPKYGLELIGQTTFTGHDTIPEGDLACNFGVRNVYKSGVTDLLLVSNAWVDGKEVHRGYDVYVRYDCPFA